MQSMGRIVTACWSAGPTVGINGFMEGAESLGIEPDADNPDYVKYAEAVLKPIYEANRRDRSDGVMWNCEMVPAENLGVKNAAWDRAEKLFVPRDCYNSYFFRVEDPKVNVLDKLKLHGMRHQKHMDVIAGGKLFERIGKLALGLGLFVGNPRLYPKFCVNTQAV